MPTKALSYKSFKEMYKILNYPLSIYIYKKIRAQDILIRIINSKRNVIFVSQIYKHDIQNISIQMCCIKISFSRYKSGPVIASISHSRDTCVRGAFFKNYRLKKMERFLNRLRSNFTALSALLSRHVSLEIAKRMVGTIGEENGREWRWKKST